jgi:hypothetical protein
MPRKKPVNNGWQVASRRREAGLSQEIAVDSPEWESVLKLAGVDESEAHHDHAIRAWVKRYCRSRYIPVKVLDAMGISQESCA